MRAATTRSGIVGALALVLLAPLAAGAQQPVKVARIGYLLTGSLESPETQAALGAFRQGLREHGYVEGQNIVIEYRTAEGRIERFPDLARELVRLTMNDMWKETETAARTLGVQVRAVEARGPDELEGAFSRMAHERFEAVLLFPTTMFFNERTRLVALAAKHRLPAMFNAREFVEIGGLIGYGASLADLTRRSAIYVDKILKGAKPGDLPVEQPTKFELAINLKAARALGITIPPSLLLRADRVID